ncbi:MAG: HTH domain-containing protein [Thermoplasmata archaeon]|nr:MAG: HTH domain-containing protein [Thermoplasmata archaeon]
MIEIERGTTEGRIIEVLLEVYPITFEELKKELGMSEAAVERGVKKLQARGIIELEPLPDKVYIRLLRRDFHFMGRKASQRTAIKRRGGKKGKADEYDGYAYG